MDEMERKELAINQLLGRIATSINSRISYSNFNSLLQDVDKTIRENPSENYDVVMVYKLYLTLCVLDKMGKHNRVNVDLSSLMSLLEASSVVVNGQILGFGDSFKRLLKRVKTFSTETLVKELKVALSMH